MMMLRSVSFSFASRESGFFVAGFWMSLFMLLSFTVSSATCSALWMTRESMGQEQGKRAYTAVDGGSTRCEPPKPYSTGFHSP